MVIDYVFVVCFSFFFGLAHLLLRMRMARTFIKKYGHSHQERQWSFLPKRKDLIAIFLLWTIAAFSAGAVYLETSESWIRKPWLMILYFVAMIAMFALVMVIADNLPLGNLISKYRPSGGPCFILDAIAGSSIIAVLLSAIESDHMNYFVMFFLPVVLIGEICVNELMSYCSWVRLGDVEC